MNAVDLKNMMHDGECEPKCNCLIAEVKHLRTRLSEAGDTEKRERETRRVLRHAVTLLERIKPQVAAWNEGDDGDLEWFREAAGTSQKT